MSVLNIALRKEDEQSEDIMIKLRQICEKAETLRAYITKEEERAKAREQFCSCKKTDCRDDICQIYKFNFSYLKCLIKF
jgi:hypothetical protein